MQLQVVALWYSLLSSSHKYKKLMACASLRNAIERSKLVAFLTAYIRYPQEEHGVLRTNIT